MGFFACYLLTPVAPPQRLRCTYVGFTVSPTRRIRQHNGELVNGAKRTTKHRPWEMIVVVHGFPSKFHALQFEYAWQHPYICRFTKERMRPLKGSKGLGHPRSVKRKLVELHEMLHVAPWTSFPLTITYTNLMIQNLVRTSSFYQWPTHMTCEVRPLHEFANCQASNSSDSATDCQDPDNGDDDSQGERTVGAVCCICDDVLSCSGLQVLRCYHSDCRAQYHALCLADHFLLEVSMFADDEGASTSEKQLLRPERGTCPDCTEELLWPLLVRDATSKPSTTPKRAKGTKRTSKKRRLVEERSAKGKTSKSFDHERDDAVEADKAGVRHAADMTHRESHSPADSFTMDSDRYDDAGWFEDDISAAEYLDDGFRTEGDEIVMSSPRRSPRPPQYHDQETTFPTVVDLTLCDD